MGHPDGVGGEEDHRARAATEPTIDRLDPLAVDAVEGLVQRGRDLVIDEVPAPEDRPRHLLGDKLDELVTKLRLAVAVDEPKRV